MQLLLHPCPSVFIRGLTSLSRASLISRAQALSHRTSRRNADPDPPRGPLRHRHRQAAGLDAGAALVAEDQPQPAGCHRLIHRGWRLLGAIARREISAARSSARRGNQRRAALRPEPGGGGFLRTPLRVAPDGEGLSRRRAGNAEANRVDLPRTNWPRPAPDWPDAGGSPRRQGIGDAFQSLASRDENFLA